MAVRFGEVSLRNQRCGLNVFQSFHFACVTEFTVAGLEPLEPGVNAFRIACQIAGFDGEGTVVTDYYVGFAVVAVNAL